MARTKPTIEIVWAGTGSKSEPSDPKKNTGWIVEKPPFEYMNWLQNRMDEFIAHVNDWGIPTWDSVTDYPALAWIRSTVDDLIYVSNTTPNLNNEPSVSAEWDSIQDYLATFFDLSYQQLLSGATIGRIVQVSAGGKQIEQSGVLVSDIRIFTNNEYLAIQNANAPTAVNAFATLNDLTGASANKMTLIQGTVDDELATTPGYIDSSSVAENNPVYPTATIYYSINGANGLTSSNWSSVLPLARPAGVKRTVMRTTGFTGATGGGGQDEDSQRGVITIDWENSRVEGYIMSIFGAGLGLQKCWRFSGSIGAGANDFLGTSQNGNFGAGDDPTFRVDGTLEEIQRLPMVGRFRNVGFEITHEL